MAGILIVAGMWALVLVPALLVRRAPLGGQLGFPVAPPARLSPGRLAPSFAPAARLPRVIDRTARRSTVIATVLVPGLLAAAIGIAGSDQAIAAVGALLLLVLATYLLLIAVTTTHR